VTVQRVEDDGTSRIWYSVADAAHALDKTEATIKRWIRNGDLHPYRHDLIPGVVLIEQTDLWRAELANTKRAGATSRFVTGWRRAAAESCDGDGDRDRVCLPGPSASRSLSSPDGRAA
jgi:hypothetical protein